MATPTPPVPPSTNHEITIVGGGRFFDKEMIIVSICALLLSLAITGTVLYLQPRVDKITKEKAEIIKIYTHDGGFLGTDKVYTVFQFEDGGTRTIRGVQGKEGDTYTINRTHYK